MLLVAKCTIRYTAASISSITLYAGASQGLQHWYDYEKAGALPMTLLRKLGPDSLYFIIFIASSTGYNYCHTRSDAPGIALSGPWLMKVLCPTRLVVVHCRWLATFTLPQERVSSNTMCMVCMYVCVCVNCDCVMSAFTTRNVLDRIPPAGNL